LTFAKSLDRQGNITGLTYPDGSQVGVSYNGAGLPSRVQRKPSGGSWSDIVSSLSYWPTGQVTTTVFGNGGTTTKTYSNTNAYRLAQLQTWVAGGLKAQDFAYTYDPVGNITQLANTANAASSSATTVFTYDSLNRLLSASTTAATSTPYLQLYSYDSLGNIQSLGGASSPGTPSAPSILDTTPLTVHHAVTSASDSFTYTVPAGGANKLLVVEILSNGAFNPSSITLNGVAATIGVHGTDGSGQHFLYTYGYLAAPTSGTFSLSFPAAQTFDYVVFTVQNAAQTNPIDASYHTGNGSATSVTTSTSTANSNDLLLSMPGFNNTGTFSSFGAGETSYITEFNDTAYNAFVDGSYKTGSTAGSQSMTINIGSAKAIDESILAVKPIPAVATSSSVNLYTYAGTGYANPDAVTQIANGLSTTTFAYDNDGNVTQKTVDGTTTTYVWDYANRLIALGAGGATTTYGYDAFGQRVIQTGTTTTTLYPFKWYSVASSTGTGAKYATTTDYVFNGDTLLATVDQQTASGIATGTAKTRYVHLDHLGSTNVVTDENDNVVQTLDYYPYGATRISASVGGTNEARKYINRFSDQSNLDYLDARYYDSSRGQFTSEDPIFLGNPKDQHLDDPQSLNSYSYSDDNPITRSDPTGKGSPLGGVAATILAVLTVALYYASLVLSSPSFQHAVSNATSAGLNSSTQIVQSLPASHPLTMPLSGGMQLPLINTGSALGIQSGVSATPLNSIPWQNINLSKGGDRVILPSPDQLAGKTPAQIEQILQGKGLTGTPTRDGNGVRYDVPGQLGDQVRLMPGNPADPDPAKQVPYGRVSQNGVKSDPFPINGNPDPNP
jgi:RHS repeat-associated protein